MYLLVNYSFGPGGCVGLVVRWVCLTDICDKMAGGHGFMSSAVSLFILIITVNCAFYDDHLRLVYYEESAMNFWRISSEYLL